MPERNPAAVTPLCVIVNPPDDLFERAAKHNIDVEAVIVRFTKPRKIIARLPFQLLAGLEIVDDPQIVQEEIDAAVSALKSA